MLLRSTSDSDSHGAGIGPDKRIGRDGYRDRRRNEKAPRTSVLACVHGGIEKLHGRWWGITCWDAQWVRDTIHRYCAGGIRIT